ncbi:unnamed protein product [Polarella glacialis]|uniref:Uncharacterized protein n=1 Tax=Polarella glacialis TaxID=89957 RepID=A0A813JKQ9_POLGL|nr:unnamed protein product [Polarella glacialis]
MPASIVAPLARGTTCPVLKILAMVGVICPVAQSVHHRCRACGPPDAVRAALMCVLRIAELPMTCLSVSAGTICLGVFLALSNSLCHRASLHGSRGVVMNSLVQRATVAGQVRGVIGLSMSICAARKHPPSVFSITFSNLLWSDKLPVC